MSLPQLAVATVMLVSALGVAPVPTIASADQTPIVSPTYPTPAPNPTPVRAQQPPEVRVVDVDGHPIRARVGGLKHLGKAPAVIFEAGGTDRLESWDPIFADVAEFAPAVAYDRPGNGESAPDGELPRPAHVAEKLHTLLRALHVRAPYVLVGHSWGGPLIRMFTGLYPNEVVGLVYVDPTDLRSEEDDQAYLRGQGFTPEAGAKHRADMYSRMIAAGGEMQVMGEVSAGYYKEFRSLPAVPDVPVTVLVSDRFEEAVWLTGPCSPRKCHEFSTRFRTERLIAVTRASTNGTLILATGRGHYIHRDDPPLVLSAIQRIITVAGEPKAR